MTTEQFQASAQYDDMVGTAAADRHDDRDFSDYLEEKKLIQEGEVLVGVEIWSGEVQGSVQDNPVSVTAIVASGEGFDNIRAEVKSGNSLRVRKVELDIPLDELFGLFKRFSITISTSGIIEGREITFDEPTR